MRSNVHSEGLLALVVGDVDAVAGEVHIHMAHHVR